MALDLTISAQSCPPGCNFTSVVFLTPYEDNVTAPPAGPEYHSTCSAPPEGELCVGRHFDFDFKALHQHRSILMENITTALSYENLHRALGLAPQIEYTYMNIDGIVLGDHCQEREPNCSTMCEPGSDCDSPHGRSQCDSGFGCVFEATHRPVCGSNQAPAQTPGNHIFLEDWTGGFDGTPETCPAGCTYSPGRQALPAPSRLPSAGLEAWIAANENSDICSTDSVLYPCELGDVKYRFESDTFFTLQTASPGIDDFNDERWTSLDGSRITWEGFHSESGELVAVRNNETIIDPRTGNLSYIPTGFWNVTVRPSVPLRTLASGTSIWRRSVMQRRDVDGSWWTHADGLWVRTCCQLSP